MPKFRKLNNSQFLSLAQKKEDLFFDKKGSLIKPIDLQKSVVAFANSNGGQILVGINDDNICNGFEYQEKYDEIIQHGILGINPKIADLNYYFIEYNNKYIINIEIPKSERVHETSKGEIYIRIGASNRKLKQEEIQSLKYKKGELKFEEELKNVDINSFKKSKYLKYYLKNQKIKSNIINYLKSNGYIYNNKPKIACLICFHDKPQNLLKCGVKINRFDMNKTSRRYAYERTRKSKDISIFGPLEVIIKSGLDSIFNILDEMHIEYPKSAITEGFVNSIIHRDYSVQEDVIINIYDNKIEIISPGGFPGNVKEEDLNKRKIIRCLRNPIINNTLFSISASVQDFHERLNQDQGEGVLTIFNEMKKAGYKEPQFKEISNKVYLILKHESAESYEHKILEYLQVNDSIANKDARELLGEEDKEKIKNVFLKLEKKGEISRINNNIAKSKIRYVLTDKFRNTKTKTDAIQGELFS